MPDLFSPAERSRVMRAVKSGDTAPELIVRRLIHAMGYRYRLHGSDLPGKPDVVLPRLGKAIFIHGCFWHRHAGCRQASTPATRPEFWAAKFAANMARDAVVEDRLITAGWRVATVWECALRKEALSQEVVNELAAWLVPSETITGAHPAAEIGRDSPRPGKQEEARHGS